MVLLMLHSPFFHKILGRGEGRENRREKIKIGGEQERGVKRKKKRKGGEEHRSC